MLRIYKYYTPHPIYTQYVATSGQNVQKSHDYKERRNSTVKTKKKSKKIIIDNRIRRGGILAVLALVLSTFCVLAFLQHRAEPEPMYVRLVSN